MATTYQCICKACQHEFTLDDGDGMYYLALICDSCGKHSSIPRHAPRPLRDGHDVPPYLTTINYYSTPPIPPENIRRFSQEELGRINEITRELMQKYWDCKDSWDDFEIQALIKLKNPCTCAGTFVSLPKPEFGKPNPMCRCPQCKSKDFSFAETGLSD